MSSNVCNRLKFGKKARKDLLCAKMQKNGYGEFDHSGTLNLALEFIELIALTCQWRDQAATVYKTSVNDSNQQKLL